uniref:Putative secreted peptide n=1 Tax=Anopheles braziliensis TaxID=58242 RepID=A0A2M3ZMT2_9DIPT
MPAASGVVRAVAYTICILGRCTGNTVSRTTYRAGRPASAASGAVACDDVIVDTLQLHQPQQIRRFGRGARVRW